MFVVADASIAVKWFLPSREAEGNSGKATALLQAVRDGQVSLRQPPHWLAEVAAVLGRISPSTARADVAVLCAMRTPVIETPEVYDVACKVAIALDQHVFDTLYHAVALLSPECTLVTADERYYRKARKLGAISLLDQLDLS